MSHRKRSTLNTLGNTFLKTIGLALIVAIPPSFAQAEAAQAQDGGATPDGDTTMMSENGVQNARASAHASASASASTRTDKQGGCQARSDASAEATAGNEHDFDRQQDERYSADGECAARAESKASASSNPRSNR